MRTITLHASPYTTGYAGFLETGHFASRWQLRQIVDGEVVGTYWPAYHDSGWSTTAKTSYTVTLPDGDYEPRVQYMNNAFETSDWSYSPDEELPEGEEPPEITVVPFTDGVDARFRTGTIMVQDADLEWKELTNLDLTNWVMQADWSDDLDNASMTATVEAFLSQTAEDSLSPFMTASLRNRNTEDTFAPLFQPGRGLRIWMPNEDEVTLPNTTMVVDAIIDTLEFSTRMKAECRDRFSNIIDRMIENAKTYESMEPHILIQQMLFDNYNLDDTDEDPPVLYTLNGTAAEPINPDDLPEDAVILSPFTQLGGSLGEAIRTIAQLVTWTIGYRRNPEGSDLPHRLTFYQPDREKVVPDKEFGPDDYFSVNSIKVSRIDVRNIVRIAFYASEEATVPGFATARNDSSIQRYGRRFMLIVLEKGSPVNTFDEAMKMAVAALHDLSEPFATKEVEMPLYWQGQIGDLYRFLPNGLHYDVSMDLAPVRLNHTVRVGNIRTTMQLRGAVIGAYRDWLELAGKATTETTSVGGLADMEVKYLGHGNDAGPIVGFGVQGDDFWLEIDAEVPDEMVEYDFIISRKVVVTAVGPGVTSDFGGYPLGEIVSLATTTTIDRTSNEQTYKDSLVGDWLWGKNADSYYMLTCNITWTVLVSLSGDPTNVIAASSLTVTEDILKPSWYE